MWGALATVGTVPMSQPNVSTKTNKAKRVVKTIGSVLFYVVIITIIAVAVMGIVAKARGKDGNLSLFGYSFYVVVTPSMSYVEDKYADFLDGHTDQIQVGDLVITKKIPSGYELQLYDIVTFYQNKRVIIHRIVDIKEATTGDVMYKTRGDANVTSDGSRTRDEFLGIMVKNAGQGAGKVVNFVQSAWGIAAIAASIAVIIVATMVAGTIKKKEDIAQEPDDLPEETSSTDNEINDAAPNGDADTRIDT